MRTARTAIIASLALGACLILPSCNKKEAKPDGKAAPGQTQSTTADAAKQNPLQGADNAAPNAAPEKSAAHPVLAPSNIGEVLTSIPCKLDNQFGAFAVFPTNPAAGQTCFSLAPDSGKEIPPFDIKANEMSFIVHQSSAIDPNSVKLIKWSAKNGKPCLQPACGSEVPSNKKSFIDPKNPGAVFLIVTPQKTVPISLPSPDFYGIIIKTGSSDTVQIPVFN